MCVTVLTAPAGTGGFDTPEKYQQSMKGYYRMISGIDIEIGKIRRLLKDQGMDKNTVIIIMGDNGYFLGERQFAGKWLMYEPSLRVPLIIYDPSARNPRIVEDMVLNIDIPSTIFEYAGLDIPGSWQGISLAGYPRGETPASVRASFICEHLWDFDNIPASEGTRTKKWKYFRYINDPDHEELYDLESDPDEATDLSGKPEFHAILEMLRAETETKTLQLKALKLQE
jgi:arylsulfatase A-like enzyme